MFIKLDKDYEVKCTLGIIREIEAKFNKSFYEVITSVDKLKTSEQIKLLYVGAKKANPELSESEFLNLCEDYLGLGELTEYLEEFIYQLQYPGLSTEEIKDKIEKKLQKVKAQREAAALTGMK